MPRAPGSSIGEHVQASGDDADFVVSGRGHALYDGVGEELFGGTYHVCLKGSRHAIANDGEQYLALRAVVI